MGENKRYVNQYRAGLFTRCRRGVLLTICRRLKNNRPFGGSFWTSA
jgi:hypothetical protein